MSGELGRASSWLRTGPSSLDGGRGGVKGQTHPQPRPRGQQWPRHIRTTAPFISDTEHRRGLPDAAGVLVDHWRALLAAERLLEFGHVSDGIIDPVLGEGVRVGENLRAKRFRTHLVTPAVGIAEEEPLAIGPAVGAFV